MQAILPQLLKHMEIETAKTNNSVSALKHEIGAFTTLCVEIKALINSCEILSRYLHFIFYF